METRWTLKYMDLSGKKHITPVSDSRVELTEKTEGGRHTLYVTAKEDLFVKSVRRARAHTCHSHTIYFLNGYQSWTDSFETRLPEGEKNIYFIPPTLVRKFALDRYGDARFYNYRVSVWHGYDVFYARGEDNFFLLNLNAKNCALVIEVRKMLKQLVLKSDFRYKPLLRGESLCVADYYEAASPEEGLEFFNRVYPYHAPEKLFGYTSWYHHYQNISEEILLRDLEGMDERFNLFQIDDGYQTFVGDWLSVNPAKFPRGLSPLVELAHRKGKMAGIWLAPLVAEKKSALFQDHPDYLARDEKGKPIRCGSNWSSFYALDLGKEEVRDYIRNCLQTYARMGFDFFKLDFLYACSVQPPAGVTRHEAASQAYAFLRECLPGKKILGCGALLFPAAGLFDYMRIGPDVSLQFDDAPYMRLMHRERISTRVTLQNTIYRSFLNGHLFGNDPDVFLLRDNDMKMSPEQRQALLTINALFGSVLLTSDTVSEYDEGKREKLRQALHLFYEAKNVSFERLGDSIRIFYELDGQKKTLVYHTKKGVLI